MSMDRMRAAGSRIKNPESLDRTSIDFFLQLKQRMVEKIGAPEEDAVMIPLHNLIVELGNLQGINAALHERPVNFPGNALDRVKDKFRKKVPGGFLHPGSASLGDKGSWIKEYKTAELMNWKASVLNYLRKLEQFENPINMLREVELDPEVTKLFKKYGKTTVFELLEPGFVIEARDLREVYFVIMSAFEYRNRKIKEFLAYRYARTAPQDMDIGDFTLNAHKILADEQTEPFYRKSFLNSVDGFHVPVAPKFVPYGMAKLNEKIYTVERSNDKKRIKKEALRYYILFEKLHPFADANGRVGRALFVYLQKRFSDSRSTLEIPTHIPISRYESGTIYPQEVTDARFERNLLGSLSLDVNTLLVRIAERTDVVSLGKVLLDSTDSGGQTLNSDELQKLDNYFESLLEILNSQEVDDAIENMVEVIEKQSALDDITSPDWNMVYESMKESLKK